MLEMTESLLARNTDDIIEKMRRLKAHGVRFSLDDFGTGYSSLRYLQRLPLDELKIDRSFVNELLTSENNGTIARAIITLAKEFGLDVIAEGVEDEGQRLFLDANGCRAYQGYLFGKPVPLDVFEASVRGKIHGRAVCPPPTPLSGALSATA
jgi:EAL domain-containing protein (putative c-di-GMP-specific phosphodiesterase class I)